MNGRYAGRVAIITGAAGGLGEALALGYALEGARVELIDRDVEGLIETRRLVEQAGGVAIVHVLDLADEDAVAGLGAALRMNHPHIHVLINNAGIAYGDINGPVDSQGLAAWTRYLAVNTVAPMLLGQALRPADLVVIGSHCTGLDRIAAALAREGFSVKVLAVGSEAGLVAARRGECDLAPIHLFDPQSGEYNRPFLEGELELIPGYRRMQGVVSRPGETRDSEVLVADPALRMVNRNRGSGTRVLVDALLGDRRPDGFAYEPRSHYAVAAAVAQGRADWGVTIETVAREAALRFRPLRHESYDFAIGRGRGAREAVRAFRRLLAPGSALRRDLEAAGFEPPEATT